MPNNSITALILAAGKGTRMRSSQAKVLHTVFFRPMLHWVLDAVQGAGVTDCAVIIGHQRQQVLETLHAFSIRPVVQEKQLGTGHAVLCAEPACRDADIVMILCGDTPLIEADTLRAMITQHNAQSAVLTLMTTVLDRPFGYGRIVSDTDGTILRIVEEKDANEEQRQIRNINAGIYLVDKKFLFFALKQVGSCNNQGEIYLTDIVSIARSQGHKPQPFAHNNPVAVLGVNSRVELAQAHSELSRRRNLLLMQDGVTMYHPDTITVAPTSAVGRDSILHPGVQILDRSTVGSSCQLEQGVILKSCQVGDEVTIGSYAVCHGQSIPSRSRIPPHSCLLTQDSALLESPSP